MAKRHPPTTDPRASVARLDLVSDPPATPAADTDPKGLTEQHADVLERARDRWKLVSEAEREQREREKDDLRFARGLREDQWPEDILHARTGGKGADGRASAARPTLTINKLRQPLIQITNEARNARLAVQVKTKDDEATEQTAEVLQGLYRAIEVDSNAQYARTWAIDRAIKAGRGYYRILTDYCDDGDFDLDVQIASIHNQGAVYLDPGATKPDASDMEWAFLIEDIALEEFRRRWPEADAGKRKGDGSARAVEMESVTDAPPGWLGDDYTRIAEYWEVQHETRTLWYHPSILTHNNRVVVDADGQQYDTTTGEPLPAPVELPDEQAPGVKVRDVDARSVRRYIITGCDVLETAEWDGRWIPIVPVTGEKHVVDGSDVTYFGVVAPAKDGQRSYNYTVSAEMEALGLTNKAPYILDPKQIEDYEQVWAQANITNPAYLPARQYDDMGRQYVPPQRNVVEPALAGIMQVVMQADADIKATTGRYDPSLGQLSSNERSGKAIRELKQQGESSSSHFLDNLATISMPHEARIVLDLIPHVYDRPGRVLRLLGKKDEERMVMVAGPDGQPMPMPATMAEPTQAFDLRKGQYTTVVSVGKSFQSQREANLDLLTSMAEATKGQIMPFIADLMAQQMDGPIGDDIAERMELMNPAIAQAKAAKQQNIPPEAQAAIVGMQQQMQQMQQQLQAAQQQIATDQVKAQAQGQIEQMKAAAQAQLRERELAIEAQLAQVKAQADAQIAQAKVAAEMEKVKLEAEVKLRLQNDQQAHELEMKRLELQWKAETEERIARAKIDADLAIAQQQAQLTRETETLRVQSQREMSERSLVAQREADDRKAQAAQAQAAATKVKKVKRDPQTGFITEIEG